MKQEHKAVPADPIREQQEREMHEDGRPNWAGAQASGPHPPPVPRMNVKPNGPSKGPRDTAHLGLLQFDLLTAERDQLEKDLAAARERIRMLELQISEIEGTRNTIESRINTCVLERDEAVGVSGELRGVVHAIADICKRYQVRHPEPEEQD